MGYVVHVFWLQVSKPDWSCALPLVWFDMQIKWEDPLSYWTIRYIFKVNAILFSSLKGTFHCCCSIQGWTCNLLYRKFWIILQHPYGNHINLGLHQHYSCDRLSPIPEYRASERPGSPWDRWLTLNKPHCITRGLHLLFSPPLGPFILPLSLPFPLPLPLGHLPFFIWSLKLWNCGLHPPFFQSPLKFIGFSGGLPVLLPRGNRDQSIHYFDRDGCGSPCTVPITRTSKGGSPLFSAWPPIQDSPLSPHYAAPL